MDVGDFFHWQGRTWLVRRVDEGSVTAYAEDADGVSLVADLHQESNPDIRVICNPLRDWPSVMLPVKSRARLAGVLNGSTPLVRFQDWVKIDEFQMGGLLFLNPALNLGFRDRLVAVYSLAGNSRTLRVPVDLPRDFSSLEQKMVRFNAQPPPPPPQPPARPTIYDAVLSDDDEL